jgi:pyrroline-5-carboxylate reductase
MPEKSRGSMRIGLIGAGQMARALAQGWVARGVVSAENLTAADCSPAALDAFRACVPAANLTERNGVVAAASDVLVLAVKPQHLPNVLAELRPLDDRTLAVSIVAGVPLVQLCEGLQSQRVVRVMPNTPALVGAAASGFCRAAGADSADAATVTQLLEAVGRCWELPEPLLDTVTGLSGSGPAYVFQFIEALSDGGVSMGLPRQTALELAAQTVLGAAQLMLTTGEHPALLKDRVASPGGTTIAGLESLERGGFRGLVMTAVRAATERSRELGRSSDADRPRSD